MKDKQMTWYVANNDFEGAKARLEATTPAWHARWFNVCQQIFDNCKSLAKKYVLDPITKTIHKVSAVIIGKKASIYDGRILMSDDCESLQNEAHQKCYLFEFLDNNNNLICSKVGTTVRSVTDRLKEELASATYRKMGAERAIIRRVYNCGDCPAEGLESFFRANYIKKYPSAFHKNDRFINIKFDLVEADNIYNQYISLAA